MRIEEQCYKRIIQKMPIFCIDLAIIENDGKYLLVKRLENPLKNEWWTPGGRVLFGETITLGIERILLQELGIKANFSWSTIGIYQDFFDNSSKGNHHYHTVSIVAKINILEPFTIILDNTSSEFCWQPNLPDRMMNKIIT